MSVRRKNKHPVKSPDVRKLSTTQKAVGKGSHAISDQCDLSLQVPHSH